MPYVSLRRRAAATAAAAILTAVAFAGPAAAATPIHTAPSPYLPGGSASDVNFQGIIMSDGRICNPRWGC